MLNITPDGNLSLTKQGRIIATLNISMIENLTVELLVQWENTARRHDFETSDDPFTLKRLEKMIQAEKRHAKEYQLYSPEETIEHLKKEREERMEGYVDS